MLHELEYITRFQASARFPLLSMFVLVPPPYPWNTVWRLEQRVDGFYVEEKSESWDVFPIAAPEWASAWRYAVDALVEFESSHRGRFPPHGSKFIATWYRLLLRLSEHFGTLRFARLHLLIDTPACTDRSPALRTPPHRRGIAGRRHRSVVEFGGEPLDKVWHMCDNSKSMPSSINYHDVHVHIEFYRMEMRSCRTIGPRCYGVFPA